MRDEHVTEILEGAPLASLGEAELVRVRAHVVVCEPCRHAYEAARVAAALLRVRAAEVHEPSPFFQTRVLAALRERREEAPALVRLWRAAGSLAASMAASVAVLAVLTFAVPTLYTLPPDGPETAGANAEPYTVESVLIASDDGAPEQLNYEQVLSTVYGGEEGGDGPDR